MTSRFVRGDALHILFCKGVCSHVLGSLLHYLIYHDGKGKQKKPPSERLGLIFQEVQKSYKETNAPTKLTNLKLSMVVDPKKPHTQYPKLEAKGAETKYFCFSFLPLLQKLLHRKIEEERHMLEALETLCLLIDFYDRTSMFLSPQEFEDSRNLGKRQKAVSYCDEISYHAPPHKKWKVHQPKVYLQLERGRLCGPGGKVEPAGVRSTRISTKTSQNIGSCCTCSSLALALAKKAYMMMNRILAKRIAGLFHSLPKGMLASPCQKEFLVKRILWLHVHFPCPKDHLLDKRGKLVLGQRSRIILAKQKKRCCSVAG